MTDFAAFSLEDLAKKPVKKNASVANGSSIALLAEYGGRAVLTTGDAHADVLAGSIKALQRARGREGERLKLHALKLSHHGSANATTNELLSTLYCGHYLVSANGNIYYHPDRESTARVILHGGKRPTLHFTYRSQYNELWDEPVLKKRYDYVTEYPDGDAAGLRISLSHAARPRTNSGGAARMYRGAAVLRTGRSRPGDRRRDACHRGVRRHGEATDVRGRSGEPARGHVPPFRRGPRSAVCAFLATSRFNPARRMAPLSAPPGGLSCWRSTRRSSSSPG